MKSLNVNPKYATSIYVVILYSVFILTLFAGFSSYISRVNLGGELVEAKVGSLDKVIFLTTRENQIRKKLEVSAQRLYEQNTGLSRLQQERSRLNSEIYLKTAALVDQFIPVSTAISIHARILDPAFVDGYRSLAQEKLDNFVHAQRLSGMLATVQYRENATPEEITTFSAVVEKVLQDLARARTDLHASEAAYDETRDQEPLLNGTIEDIQAQIEKHEQALAKIDEVINNEHRALIASFKNSFDGLLYRLIQVPTIILTMIVTIAAGGLGSVVAFTKNFVRGEAKATPGLLFVNVGEGVAAAVAIFLFAGAGMLMLTQGAGGSGGAIELTPYMVAFIAFVSGFMAEDAFSRIQSAGKQMFRDPNSPNGQGSGENQG